MQMCMAFVPGPIAQKTTAEQSINNTLVWFEATLLIKEESAILSERPALGMLAGFACFALQRTGAVVAARRGGAGTSTSGAMGEATMSS